MSHIYALVFKKNKINTWSDKDGIIKTMDIYEEMLSRILKLYPDTTIDYTYELKNKKHNRVNVHLHAMLRTDTPRELFCEPRKKGISTYFEECNSMLAWFIYCQKEPYTRDHVLQEVDLNNYGTLKVHTLSQEREEELKLQRFIKSKRLV